MVFCGELTTSTIRGMAIGSSGGNKRSTNIACSTFSDALARTSGSNVKLEFSVRTVSGARGLPCIIMLGVFSKSIASGVLGATKATSKSACTLKSGALLKLNTSEVSAWICFFCGLAGKTNSETASKSDIISLSASTLIFSSLGLSIFCKTVAKY